MQTPWTRPTCRHLSLITWRTINRCVKQVAVRGTTTALTSLWQQTHASLWWMTSLIRCENRTISGAWRHGNLAAQGLNYFSTRVFRNDRPSEASGLSHLFCWCLKRRQFVRINARRWGSGNLRNDTIPSFYIFRLNCKVGRGFFSWNVEAHMEACGAGVELDVYRVTCARKAELSNSIRSTLNYVSQSVAEMSPANLAKNLPLSDLCAAAATLSMTTV